MANHPPQVPATRGWQRALWRSKRMVAVGSTFYSIRTWLNLQFSPLHGTGQSPLNISRCISSARDSEVWAVNSEHKEVSNLSPPQAWNSPAHHSTSCTPPRLLHRTEPRELSSGCLPNLSPFPATESPATTSVIHAIHSSPDENVPKIKRLILKTCIWKQTPRFCGKMTDETRYAVYLPHTPHWQHPKQMFWFPGALQQMHRRISSPSLPPGRMSPAA